jgi:hypothetical protein
VSGMFDDELAEANTATWAVPLGWRADNVGSCRSCGASVMWCFTPAGKKAPINPDGTSHFATCPQADAWRKRGGA